MRGFLAKDKKPDHTQMPNWFPSPARNPRRKNRRPPPSSSRRNFYKPRPGTTPGGTFHRRMYPSVINMKSTGYLRIKAAKARRAAQIASAKARRAREALEAKSLARRTNLMAKFKRFK